MDERIAGLRARLREECLRVTSRRQVEELRTLFFGRKQGLLTLALKELGGLPPPERAAFGKAVNELKGEAEAEIERLLAAAERSESEAGARESPLDGLVPSRPPRGTAHPISLLREELEDIFLELGFSIAEGPEIEDEFHNFEALNVPADHPSRDEHDTLYLEGGLLLRTHTSNVQVRTMRAGSPPFRIVAPGRCYRRDAPDLTHSPMFHQIEGLVVDEDVSMAHLKGTLEQLSRRLFGATSVRLRPSFFPFTEPSAELDISCFGCEQRGCPLCKGSGFIELGGCGMVDPAVFAAVGIDAERWTGFAFGFGIERAALLKHGIDSIRLLFENDLRFLEQFPARV